MNHIGGRNRIVGQIGLVDESDIKLETRSLKRFYRLPRLWNKTRNYADVAVIMTGRQEAINAWKRGDA